MRTLMLVVILFLLSGCATNYVKVTGMDAAGQYLPFGTARLGGCIVEQEGTIDGLSITYSDEKCTVKVSKKETP